MKYTLSIFALFLFAACSAEKPSSRGLEVSFSSIVSSNIVGGAVVRIENPSTNTFQDIELVSAPFTVVIPDGTWNIYFVGFIGPGAWQGVSHCGSSLNLKLAPETASINISVSTAACPNAPYSTIVANKQPVWDASTWDQTNWAP